MNIPAYLEGNLVKDPEIKYTKDGKPWARMRVAVEEREFVDGEWRDAPASFHDVNAFGHVAKQAERLGKGDRIVAAGEMQIREYVDAEGKTRTGVALAARHVGRSIRFEGVDRGGEVDGPSASVARGVDTGPVATPVDWVVAPIPGAQ